MGTNSTSVYTTSTDGQVSFDGLDQDLRYELGLTASESNKLNPFYDESDYYDEWCFVCSRPTDHRGEHDDLVEQGLASYDSHGSMVYNRG